MACDCDGEDTWYGWDSPEAMGCICGCAGEDTWYGWDSQEVEEGCFGCDPDEDSYDDEDMTAMNSFPKDQVVRVKGKAMEALRIACYLRDGGRCVICATITWLNAPEEHPRKADMAHVKSRGAGGQDILSNVRNLCHRCHTREHTEGKNGKPCPSKLEVTQ
jgi:hypothetical protein